MFNLVRNENMKIYRRIRTWVLIGLIIVLPIVVSLIIHNNGSNVQKGDWRADAQQQVEQGKREVAADVPQTFKDQIQKNVSVNEYRLQHNLPPAGENVWDYVMTMSNLIRFVTIFTIIVAADIVAGEFTGGTIKLLLIRPVSRTKILASKYIATLIFSVLLLLVLFLTSFLIGGILSGFGEVGTPYLYAGKDFVVHEDSMLLHAISTYGLKCVELVMVVTMAFMISTVFRSSSLAIGISMLTMLVGSGVLLFVKKYSWAKYYLFANTNLTQYIEGSPMLAGMTMSFSIAVLIGYFLIFNGLSWLIFNKRDVAA